MFTIQSDESTSVPPPLNLVVYVAASKLFRPVYSRVVGTNGTQRYAVFACESKESNVFNAKIAVKI